MLDTVGDWQEAEVCELDAGPGGGGGGRVFVHYVYWTTRWDEWLPADSERLQPHGSHTYTMGAPLAERQLVDVFDNAPARAAWASARVAAVRDGQALLRYRNYVPPCEEWVPVMGCPRVAPFGAYTRTRTRYRPKPAEYWSGRGRARQLEPVGGGGAGDSAENGAAGGSGGAGGGAADPRAVRYVSALAGRGMAVSPMGGDGNCLFRSVAHQVYGDEGAHRIVRAAAVEYMAGEAAWFSGFVVGAASEFPGYVARMRCDGVWGDEPEIQALCEVYDRPAEIWAYDAVLGARRLRTFNSSAADAPDLRPPVPDTVSEMVGMGLQAGNPVRVPEAV